MTTTALPETLNGTWDIDPAHTSLGFSVKHAMVTTVRGSFKAFSGTLTLDAADPAKSSAEVSLDVSSIDTGNEGRDQHVASPDFLDAAAYPAITFRSTGVRADGDSFVLDGDLTIRDTTKPISLDVEFGGVANDLSGNVRTGFEGRAEISRKDFGVEFNAPLSTGGVIVSDKVKIELDVSAIKKS